jgi:hypothetical protein
MRRHRAPAIEQPEIFHAGDRLSPASDPQFAVNLAIVPLDGIQALLEWYADSTTPYAKAELTTKRDARIIVACASGGRSPLESFCLVLCFYYS